MIRRVLVLAVLATAIAGPAFAAVLHTPPLANAGQTFVCQITNTGKKPGEVKIEILLAGGGLNVSTLTATANPGETKSLANTSNSNVVCRFTVDGPKKAFLGSACILVAGTGCVSVIGAQ